MMNDTFMKEKPVLPLILSMSLPMVLSMLVNSLYNIVDSFFVAQISEEAMTALSLVYPVQNFINAAGIGFGVGINAVIALYLGAGDHRKADQAATQGLVLAVIHGVVMTVCCITIMPVFLRMFTSSEVPLLPYMDRPADTRAGCKHRCTDAAMEYFKAEVMEMCYRENLYQIDLLHGSKNRITEREYWAQKKGQTLRGVGAIALGYPAKEAGQPAARKQNYIVRI